MEFAAAATNIHWGAILLATLVAFVIGGIWYGPVFGRAWMVVLAIDEQSLETRPLKRTFGVSLLLSCLAAVNLEMFLGPDATLVFGLCAGFFAGFGWVSTFLGILYLFEMRSFKAFLINAGYCTLTLTAMGAILGAM